MIRLVRTNSENPDFIKLVSDLDADLATRDGEDHAFYAQFNSIENLNQAVIAFDDDQAVGCGAIKAFENNVAEVKRMFTKPTCRGKGIATKILIELENWASELGFHSTILETGKRQPEAINLYLKNGYDIIDNYGQYKGVDNSVCFEKKLARE